VAAETHGTPETTQPQVSRSVLTGIAMIGGLGITLMMIAAGIGVILPDAPSDVIGLVVALGAGLLITAIAGWIIAARPHEHFDDITVPQYHGHQHDEHSDNH
jgi:multisubunit Na+/H+ antiporter MnhB subunit